MMRNPNDGREAVRRELEKEQIREGVIEEEIKRWKMMMERESAMRRTVGGFPIMPPPMAAAPGMPYDFRIRLHSQHDGGLLDEKLPFSVGREVGTGFHLSTLAHNSEAQFPEDRPGPSVSGVNRKSVTPLVTTTGEASAAASMKKLNVESKWSCAFCQVVASSECNLNKHLQGKRHKLNQLKVGGHGNSELGKKLEESQEAERRKSLMQNLNAEDLQENDGCMVWKRQDGEDSTNKREVMVEKLHGTGDRKKRDFRFWCEICQTMPSSEADMNAHKKGNKCMARILEPNC